MIQYTYLLNKAMFLIVIERSGPKHEKTVHLPKQALCFALTRPNRKCQLIFARSLIHGLC